MPAGKIGDWRPIKRWPLIHSETHRDETTNPLEISGALQVFVLPTLCVRN
jgi:hypothetical protein